jgi:D-threo-aldose 1-dehydrogenase
MKKRIFKAPSGQSITLTELGFGCAPIGNLYRPVSEDDALKTLDAAWKAGIRYFDTAPLYGLGLSETRLNHFLRGKKRTDYVISRSARLTSAPASASSSIRLHARSATIIPTMG